MGPGIVTGRVVFVVLVNGCLWPPVDGEPIIDVQLSTPSLSEFTLICDLERERWQLDARATSWTGGGEWWWTTDGTYVERHTIYSRKAAADGSWDELRLRLNIVADWRDAEQNRSTPFLCASEPTGRFVLFDPDGATVDCHDEGPDEDWLETYSGLPGCPED